MHKGKAWPFSGSDRGGECAAAMYSLIATALCRARHNAVYAARRTMPNGLVSVRNGRDPGGIGSV
jgi:transposase